VRIPFILCLLAIGFNSSYGQRYLGNHIGGFSGVYGIQENPASFVYKRPKWDINLVGTGLFAYTDYGFLKDETFFSMINKDIVNGMDSIPANFNADQSSLFYANAYDKSLIGLMYQQTIHLPSFCFKLKRFSLGAFANVKIAADAMEAPNFFSYGKLQNLIDYTPYTVTAFSANTMAWGEIGLHMGYAHELENGHTLALGINPKYLLGFEAAYIQNKSDYNFYRERDTFFASTANIGMGFATGASRTTNDYRLGVLGTGLGLDIGAEYIIPNQGDDEGNKSPHYMKFGVSIKDLGSIRFDKNTEQHNYAVKDLDFGVLKSIHKNLPHNYDILKRLSAAIYQGDSAKSKVSEEMTFYTPTSLNLTWDYNLRKNIYLHAFISRRLKTLERQIAAPNVIAVGGRFEQRWLEAGASVSITEDKWFGVGTYVRLGLLTVGTDHINALLFGQPRLRGADIYMSLKIMPFGNGEHKDLGIDNIGNNRGKRAGCYNQ